MKLAAPAARSTKRLKEVALQRGHEARVLNALKFAIHLDRGSPDLHYRQDLDLPAVG